MPDLVATGICPAAVILGAGWWAVSAWGRWLDRTMPIEAEDTVDQYDDAPTLREESIPMPGMVEFRGALVHEDCLTAWLRGGQLADECARYLRDDVQAGAA